MPKCPRCASTNPRLHPAVQLGGEVHVCTDPYHKPYYGPARAGIEAQNGLNDVFPGDPAPRNGWTSAGPAKHV